MFKAENGTVEHGFDFMKSMRYTVGAQKAFNIFAIKKGAII